MPSTTSAEHSLWIQTAPGPERPALAGGLEVDAAVIGGGIAGLSTAHLLKREGASVALLEAERVGHGVTGCTTAKVSALQGTIYSTIRGRRGSEAASAYAHASLAGVEGLASFAGEESIECDLARRPAFTYAAEPPEREAIESELEVAREAGLPVELVEEVDLPYPTHGAVALRDQLEIHPLRYVQGLAAAVEGDGSHVFERTRALSVSEGSPCLVETEHGSVRAGHVVIATHYPILDRGLYFAQLEAQRSYCIAAEIGGEAPTGLSISAGSPTRSIRSYEGRLIVGGEGHATGSREATPERFAALEAFARRHWDVGSVSHRWSAHDPVPFDHLPIIGPYRPRSSRLWVATGFMKWGLASATFAARILADSIAGRPGAQPWADAFAPRLPTLRSAPEVAKLGAKFTLDFVADRVRPGEAQGVEHVAPGEGRIVSDGLARRAVYRDEEGTARVLSARCTHLGCLVRFNSAERTWDCPCHGSRFGVDGSVLEGPAVRPLEQLHDTD